LKGSLSSFVVDNAVIMGVKLPKMNELRGTSLKAIGIVRNEVKRPLK
jgi:hypothetical protein